MANLKMGESEDPDQFFGKVDSLQVRLNALGHEYTEVMLRTMCMVKFPSSYRTLRTCIQANKSQSYEEFKEQVRLFWRTEILVGEGTGDKDGTTKALAATVENKSLKCFGCGSPGHLLPDCPKRRTSKGSGGYNNRGNGFSTRGRGKGQRGGRGGRDNSDGKRYNNSGNKDSSTYSSIAPIGNGKCFICDRRGHIAFNCPEKRRYRDAASKANNTTTVYEDHGAYTAALSVTDDRRSRVSGVDHHTRQQQSNAWVVYSGCTTHMCNSREVLSDIRWGKGQVILANGKVLDSIGIGRIRGKAEADDGKLVSISASTTSCLFQT
jgi:hypothetical protein